MSLRVNRLQETPLQTLSQLQALLLSRIPQNPEHFLQPPHPADLPQEWHGISQAHLQSARERIESVAQAGGRIVIFGDYDCDGVTATTVLWETLRKAGIESWPFLPHREKHGYGLSLAGLADVFEKGKPDLVITVDNGIVAHEAVSWLKQQGVAVIVTDHHEALETPVAADLILHSTRLAGVTVSWLLAHAIDPDFAREQLDLAAIGTIADQVPLTGANRSFAWHGLQTLRQTKRTSLQTLAQVAGLDVRKATASTIHFGFAPRINAMGRLYDPMDALRALVSRNSERTRALMEQLQSVNVERQSLTAEAVAVFTQEAEKQKNQSLMIVQGNFHEGIIGLIASKLVDLTHKPSIVLSNLPDKAKASCRSVAGVHLTEFLRSLPVEYLSLGGHAMAAGFSLARENVEKFISLAQKQAQEQFDPRLFTPSFDVLAPLSWSLLTPETVDVIEQFAPFGSGNPEPLFSLQGVQIVDAQPVGKLQNHHKLWLRETQSGYSHEAIVFETSKKLPGNLESYSELFVRLEKSNYRKGRLELHVLAGQ